MRIVDQLDSTTRVVVKRFCWEYWGAAIILQRKIGKRWKNVAQVRPEVVLNESPETIRKYLLWKERQCDFPKNEYEAAVWLFKDRDSKRK
jgi:hypothetical protein|nr:MAG TPA: hypothetical protein [Caudoviricetes sp.]